MQFPVDNPDLCTHLLLASPITMCMMMMRRTMMMNMVNMRMRMMIDFVRRNVLVNVGIAFQNICFTLMFFAPGIVLGSYGMQDLKPGANYTFYHPPPLSSTLRCIGWAVLVPCQGFNQVQSSSLALHPSSLPLLQKKHLLQC